MCHIGITILLLVVFLFHPEFAIAQIAPTNSATISGSVSDVAGKPVVGGQVSLKGPKHAATETDSHGDFIFVGVPFGDYQISTVATGLGTITRAFSVQGDTNLAIQYEPTSVNGLKTIASVNTSANARFNVTSASITQVNPMQSTFEGNTSWRTILEQIPGVAQAGLGNGGSVYAALPDSPIVPVQISINGALPYETATLLDDMPLIGSSASVGSAGAGTGTDLSFYPLNGFSTADVVRGPGANAPSIVDSIGGSFVLHSPGVITENHYDLSVSTDPYGGIVTNLLAAVHWKKLSTIVTYGVNDSPGPAVSTGIPGSAGTVITPSTINGVGPFSPYTPPCSSPCQFGNYLVSPNYATLQGFYGYQQGLLMCCLSIQNTSWSEHSGSFALNYMLSPSTSAGFFYAGQTISYVSPYQYVTVNFAPPAGYTGAIGAGQYFFSSNSFLTPVYNEQASSLLEEKITTQLGSGLLRLAALQNRIFSTFSRSTPASASVQLFGGGTLNGTPTIFNGGTYDVTFTPLSALSSDGNDNRDLLLSYTTPLGENFHAGASFVKSYYNIPGNSLCIFNGIPISSSATPSAISQTTNEFRLFVGGNPSEKTSLDLSMYLVNADYHLPANYMGSPNNNIMYTDQRYSYAAPRLGFIWRPTAAVAVRAAAGGGFAEAPLNDLAGFNGIFNYGAYYVQDKQNLNLQPEKSFGFDLGTDIRLRRNMVLSFDVYRSNLYGQIYNSTSLTGTYLGAPLYTTEYGNLGISRYEGILLDVRHDVPQGLYWSLSGGLTRGYLVSVPTGFYNTAGGTCVLSTGAYCQNLTVVPNINFNGQFATSIPYSQGLGVFGYRWSQEKYLNLTMTYYGNNNTYFRPAFAEFNGNIGYPVTKNMSLLVTFRNITGVYDGPTQTFSAANLSGAPTITGLPYPLYGEEYGPRTIILTMDIHT